MDRSKTVSIFPCTAELAARLHAHLHGDLDLPEINTQLARHRSAEAFARRIADSIRFRTAIHGPDEVRVPHRKAGQPIETMVQEVDGWLFMSRGECDGEIAPNAPRRVSTQLAAVIKANGFAMPGFWRDVRGVTHHLDEFADNVPSATLSGKLIRHQNRHT